ncbi:HAD family hydrolase [Streptomyces acidiscabies]|uniref:HAD family phosphatase n=1 Tax=Streptomyces acidiscabies TaxID=42234 RepID=A0AAP6BIY4_9ACTN|nr:HAD family phosphatase [Streptomyces acidiscabies]MBP5935397.1 HAD family phosphatase [Streptomyces sp. LBUM 1476]MBZ3916754.1 HAD family phosphatase [Streptomyces acidiscabies]MDX2965608.1 HAD family phosphatase [Streptomyces acidiscabies]MDX3024890.1 HAD family phosphatase [Streptomyces acidiscabies]MDX3795524.1 HAD family phosphatase [Streptomyces acidiscabies]
MTTPTPPTAQTGIDALIIDYNGVIGLQPDAARWRRLAALAGYPDAHLASFQEAFWSQRPAYDAGECSDLAFWTAVLGAHPGPRLLRDLVDTDTAMWTRTDPRILSALARAHAAGLPITLLSNAPAPLCDVLDATHWRRTLITHALYSARLHVSKPDPRAYEHALAASAVRDRARALFVDDRTDNIRAAAGLGMRTLHYTGNPEDLEQRIVPRSTGTPVS